MTKTVRETKRVDELKLGDWLAAGNLPNDGDHPAEVLGVHLFTDEDGPSALLVYRTASGRADAISSYPYVKYDLATQDELSAGREAAERAGKIADLRHAVDFLDQRPWLPLPDVHVHVHLQDDVVGNYRTVRGLAEREGVRLDTSLNDRTVLNLRAGALYYSAIAWHKDGRPVEPKPPVDPDASMEAHYDAEADR